MILLIEWKSKNFYPIIDLGEWKSINFNSMIVLIEWQSLYFSSSMQSWVPRENPDNRFNYHRYPVILGMVGMEFGQFFSLKLKSTRGLDEMVGRASALWPSA